MNMSYVAAHELRVTILRLARRVRSERSTADDVTDGQRSVLFLLYSDGAQTLRSLSDHERVTPPSMNRTVNALETAGLVSKETSATDARKVTIDLTPTGRKIVDETKRRRDAWFSARLAKLTPHELQILDEAGPILRGLADS
jgi:DNA-binding MarR family transcriptional regulator